MSGIQVECTQHPKILQGNKTHEHENIILRCLIFFINLLKIPKAAGAPALTLLMSLNPLSSKYSLNSSSIEACYIKELKKC